MVTTPDLGLPLLETQQQQPNVTHNEMVLHKLPNALYERYMRYFHHTKPNDEQRTKLENIMDANEFGELTRKPEFSVGDGMEEMQNELKRATKAVPTFS